MRKQIGFYASTPAYAPVLEHHGWGGLHREANALTKQDRGGTSWPTWSTTRCSVHSR